MKKYYKYKYYFIQSTNMCCVHIYGTQQGTLQGTGYSQQHNTQSLLGMSHCGAGVMTENNPENT